MPCGFQGVIASHAPSQYYLTRIIVLFSAHCEPSNEWMCDGSTSWSNVGSPMQLRDPQLFFQLMSLMILGMLRVGLPTAQRSSAIFPPELSPYASPSTVPSSLQHGTCIPVSCFQLFSCSALHLNFFRQKFVASLNKNTFDWYASSCSGIALVSKNSVVQGRNAPTRARYVPAQLGMR